MNTYGKYLKKKINIVNIKFDAETQKSVLELFSISKYIACTLLISDQIQKDVL